MRIGVHCADIHLGVRLISADDFKYQLYESFIKPLSKMMFVDFITINGDISDCPLSFNSKIAETYLWFFDSIVDIAKQKNSAIIVIKGTLSHECDHLNNVKFYLNDKDLEIHFVEEPTVIETRGVRLYCLPDIYVKSEEEEKKIYDYPDRHFDYILGHGSITETQFVKQETEHSISKNIVYNSKELIRMSKGPILFGHIHQNLEYRKRIFYINSFTRFSHSEEEPKGFMVTAYDCESSKFLAERIENKLAFKFNTFFMKHNEFEKMDINEIVERIDRFIEKNSVDRLCLDIQYMNTSANIAKIQVLRNYYGKHKVVNKLKFKSLSVKEVEILDNIEEQQTNSKDYLRDKSLKFEEKLQRFIKEEYGEFIPLEKLQLLITSDELLTRD